MRIPIKLYNVCVPSVRTRSCALLRSLKFVNMSQCLNRNFSSSHQIAKEIDEIK